MTHEQDRAGVDENVLAPIRAHWEYLSGRHARTLEAIRARAARGEKVRIAILAYQHANVDNFSRLYPLLASAPEFSVTVVVAPYLYGKAHGMPDRIRQAEAFLQAKNIPCLRGYDHGTREFLKVNELVRPDVVLMESDYDWNHVNFLPESFPDSLYCYIPYGSHLAANTRYHAVQKVMNQAYAIFSTLRPEISMFKAHSLIRGANVCEDYLGALKLDPIFDAAYVPKKTWKDTGGSLKKIIWAPHHTWAWYGNFPHYGNFMLKLAFTYRHALQIAFKPHPALRESLREKNGWSGQRIDDYYGKWATLGNGQLEEGEWLDLFLESDAMILDSVSFMAEYSATGKPACYVTGWGAASSPPPFNEAGEEVFRTLYHAGCEADILDFVETVVLGGRDVLKPGRLDYVRRSLVTENGAPACVNYCNYLKKLCLP